MVAGGCDSELNDTIKFCSECPNPQINILTVDTAICQGDTALIRVELNGAADYSLYYNIDGIPLSTTNISQDHIEIPVWTGGVLVIDSLRDVNCLNDTATNNITITLNPSPLLDLGDDSSVCAGPVVLDAGSSGATEYLWKGDSKDPSYSADTTGNYWVIATKNACSDTDSINITIGGDLPVFLGNDTSLCDKDTLTLSVGDYNTINWRDTINNTGTDKSFEVTKGTRVYVYIKDTEGCEGNDSIDVVFKPTPVVSLSLKDTITICQTSGDYIFDAGNVGSDYLWSTGDKTQTITKGKNDEGDYWVKVTKNGCSDSDSVYLKVDTKLSVYLGEDTIGVCPGGDTLMDAGYGLGYTFDWNDGNGPILDSTFRSGGGKEVKVIVSDAGGCTGKDSVFIKEINPLVINIGNDTSLCFGSPSLSFSMVSGRQDVTVKSWHDGTTTDYSFPSDSTHWYWLEVDSSGCVYRDSLYFELDTLPVVQLGVDTFICTGTSDTIKLSVGTFSDYVWNKIMNSGDSLIGTSSVYSIGDPGSYSLHVTDGNKCENGDTVNVSLQPGTVFTLLKDTTICPKGNVAIDVPSQLQGLPNTSWKWLNNNLSDLNYVVENRNHLDTIDVVLEYTNEFGCVTRDTTRVIVNNNLPVLLKDTSVCVGDYLELTSGYPDNSSYIYDWKSGSSALSSKNNYIIDSAIVGDAGTITVTVENITEGCSGDTSIVLVVNVLPDPELSSGAVCFGESVVLDHGLTNVTSVWDHGEVTNPVTVQDSGIYRVTVKDDNDCMGTDSVRVIMYDNPVSDLEDEVIVCFDDMDSRLSLDPGNYDSYTYEWSYGSSSDVISTSQIVAADQRGIYRVTLTNLANCSTVDSISVKEDCPAHVWLPNSFTPNDNTVNDVWEIVGRGIETVEVLVYNRWGELVWTGNAMGDFWDGTHHVTREPVQQDVYVYRLKYTYLNVEGGTVNKQRVGRIALIR